MSFTVQPAEPRRPRWRAAVAALIAIFALGMAAVLPVAAAPASPGPGFTDFVYKADTDTGTGGNDVTSFRNQSKLWFNDGRWWGILFDRGTAPLTDGDYRIQSFNMATQAWTSSSTATRVDDRNRSHADVLWDGTNLFVASSHERGANKAPNGDLRLYRYSYNSTSKTYALASGFPKVIDTNGSAGGNGTYAVTITKAPNGMLWVAYRKGTNVMVAHSSNSSGAFWGTPFVIPGMGDAVTTDDMTAITTVGTNGVGVLWSNQTLGDEAFYFAAHKDGDPDGTWGARETAFGGSGTATADGHISMKTDANGRVIAAVKTSRTTGSDPLIDVIARTGQADAAGTWTNRIVSNVSQNGTRPVLVLDSENNEANVFITNTAGGVGHYLITRRTAPLASLSFGAASIGTPFISNTATGHLNNASSTKQITSAASGILLQAEDIDTRTYLHGCAGSVCPVAPTAAFSGSPTSGTAPLDVQFTDASTGNVATWAWTFGDGGTSTLQNPIHTYNPGTYDVSLTVTNAAGTDSITKTNYITVAVPPGATFTSITPVRVLDTRVGTGLSGVFHANTPRDFQVTGGTIPGSAVAVTGNITVTQQTKGGYIVLAPSAGGTTSTINFPVGDNRANGVTVALSGSGSLNAVYKAAPGATTHILFDVTGYFENGAGGAKFHSITPERVLDSRINQGHTGAFHANTATDFQVTNGGTIPNTAVAVTGNITVTQQTKGGYLVLAPTSGGTTSTINFPVGDNRANGVTVPLGAGGKLNVEYKAAAGATTHILFDVTGYFMTGAGGAAYFPLAPERVLDSRINQGHTGAFHANTAADFQVTNGASGTIPDASVAVTGNITVTQQTKGGYIVLAPAAGGTTSTINFPVGDNRANGVTVPVSGTGTLNANYKAAAGATTAILFDVTGYFR